MVIQLGRHARAAGIGADSDGHLLRGEPAIEFVLQLIVMPVDEVEPVGEQPSRLGRNVVFEGHAPLSLAGAPGVDAEVLPAHACGEPAGAGATEILEVGKVNRFAVCGDLHRSRPRAEDTAAVAAHVDGILRIGL